MRKPTRTSRAPLLALALALAPVAAAGPATAAPAPTFVLVHGAFADTTSWDAVAAELRADGHRVVVPDNPLRGPAHDAAAIQRTLDTVDGPVVLVGHSYGGSVITQIHDAEVTALVYIAAFAPASGEVNQLALDPIRFPGSRLLPPVLQVGVVDDGNGVAGKNIDATIAADSFHEVFAQDVDPATAARMLAHQRSLAVAANLEPSGTPAWSSTPTRYLISTADRAIPPASQRFMADRMGAHAAEIDASHAALVSRPREVAAFVAAAAG
ncbi:alpha/beta hydrolase [Nocardia otitidiscaviarum]|uniref:Alpha/beta hydrolase n=1 Tax=Nocardia otitidiscaviarum TaxID=1823 RepID=A0A516NN74_9NOCA|nr:alpha/beta hydrolase [Nocardia otitidiscaviarum]MCP9619462.1 alpha/beta hydrolase [Nocardia otitidiscaviarum]QDP80353.1 alpha/beta hydrolase [Nocardia otitidiscaviarum]